MSDTPRTDAVWEKFETDLRGELEPDVEFSTLARQLERELNTANQRIKRLEEAGDYLCAAAAFLGWHDKIDEWNKAKGDKL